MRLPFRIDRERRTGLAEQMVEGFKAAIARGVYRPGEALPGILELADTAGVNAKVPRTALARLAEEGWVKPRRGVWPGKMGGQQMVWVQPGGFDRTNKENPGIEGIYVDRMELEEIE